MVPRNTYPLVAMLLITICASACSEKPETFSDEYDEQKMEQAIQESQSTFDEFLARFRNPKPGDAGFHVKVRIEDGDDAEQFWLGTLKLDKQPYSGTIDNEPGIVSNVKLGQRYNFTKDDISDWMYMSNGKMQGNRTLRVLMESMPKEEADALKQQFGW